MAVDPHKNRLDVLNQVKELKRKLPIIRKMDDFKGEFDAMFPDIEEDIRIHKERLEEKRPIVVVGETSAGKSSFLNLMLGVQLLPTAHQHSTAGIIKVQKSEKLAIRPKGGKVIFPDNPSLDQRNAAKFVNSALKDMVTSKHAGAIADETTDYTEVEIDWPFENVLLKEDITIVDTPGYGETKQMKDMLMQYLSKAVGFIYVINAGNAGGIQEDRLKEIIRDQINYCGDHKVELMKPERALFFFNKWDQIEHNDDDDSDDFDDGSTDKRANDEAQNQVWDTNVKKLKTAWDEFEPTQAMKFSVKKAKKSDCQCIGIDLDQENIARVKIVSVVEESLRNGLDPTKTWLKRVNSFITSTISKHLQIAKATKEQRDKMMRDYQGKKSGVEDQRIRMKENIKRKIREETRKFAQNLQRHINSDQVKREMEKWEYGDFPCSLITSSNETIKRKTARVVLDRLATIIKRDMENETKQFSASLGKYIQTETKKLIALLKDLDSILVLAPTVLKIQVSEMSIIQGNVIHYDCMAFNYWDTSNLVGASLILGLFLSEAFFLLILVALPFLFLASLLGAFSFSSPHAMILKKTSVEVIEHVNTDTLCKAILEKLQQLEGKVNALLDKEIPNNLLSLERQFTNMCSSTKEVPERIIDRYTGLMTDLDSYLRECEQVLKNVNDVL